MSNTLEITKEVNKEFNVVEIKTGIENFMEATGHHYEAARHHIDAAKYHEEGNHAKAHESAILAHGHSYIAVIARKKMPYITL